MAANFIFLASDNEEEEDRSTASQVMTKKVKAGSGVKDIQTHVFVWGLNDKDQLGGPKGSKVNHGGIDGMFRKLNSVIHLAHAYDSCQCNIQINILKTKVNLWFECYDFRSRLP